MPEQTWCDWLQNTDKEHKEELDNIAKSLIFLANLKEHITVLDLGTGLGRMPFEISKKKKNVKSIGIDQDENCIKECLKKQEQENLKDCTEFIHADLDNGIPMPDNSVDVVFSRSVILHIKNKTELIKDIKRVLKPHGKVVIFELNMHIQNNNFYRYLDKKSPRYEFFKQKELLARNDLENPITNFSLNSLINNFENNKIECISKKFLYNSVYYYCTQKCNILQGEETNLPIKFSLRDLFLKYLTEEELDEYLHLLEEKTLNKITNIQNNILIASFQNEPSFIDKISAKVRNFLLDFMNFNIFHKSEMLINTIEKIKCKVNIIELYIKYDYTELIKEYGKIRTYCYIFGQIGKTIFTDKFK